MHSNILYFSALRFNNFIRSFYLNSLNCLVHHEVLHQWLFYFVFWQNLGNLIRLPSGCGEQNLIRFAPNIYVLQYLEASKQINKPTKDKILRFMRSGE